MAKTRSTTSNQNNDGPWSDPNHDVLFVVMMRLGFVDFPAFRRVCKSWRALALSNTKRFLTSRPPMHMRISPPPMSMSMSMSMCISPRAYMKTCHLMDFEGRKFKTIIPHSVGRECIGVTCGYLILFGRKTRDFWLVNPITRHQLRFPCIPFYIYMLPIPGLVRAILVFSPSLNGWVFLVLHMFFSKIWFSIAGKGAWNHVSSPSPIIDIHAFKGKIYTLICSDIIRREYRLCQMRLDPHPKLTLLQTKNFPKPISTPKFVSSVENLYVVHYLSGDAYSFHELAFGDMKWVCCEKTREEYAFFSSWKHATKTCAYKRESWAETKNSWKDTSHSARMWYFPHDCLNVNIIDDYYTC